MKLKVAFHLSWNFLKPTKELYSVLGECYLPRLHPAKVLTYFPASLAIDYLQSCT